MKCIESLTINLPIKSCHRQVTLIRMNSDAGGRGALECNMTEKCPIFKESPPPVYLHFNTLFRNFRLQNNRETIVHCSSINKHNLFKNFWSVFIPQEFRLKHYTLKNGMPR